MSYFRDPYSYGGPYRFGGPELDPQIEPFDYQIEMPDAKAAPKKKGFFKKGGGFWDILGFMGDSLAGNDHFASHKADQERQSRELEELRRQQQLLSFYRPYGPISAGRDPYR